MSDRFGTIPIQPPESLPSAQKPLPQLPTPLPALGPAGKKSAPRRRRLGGVWLLVSILAITVAAYSALGFGGVPYYFTTILPADFYAKTSMVLMPTTVRFNPFTLQFTTGELRILAPAGGPIVAVDSLQATLAPLALLRGDIRCTTLFINGAALNLTREKDGAYNFFPLFGTAKDHIMADIASGELPWLAALNNISITNGTIIFSDKLAGKTHTADKIHLDLPTYANTSRKSTQYLQPHFSATINGSPIELTGQAMLGQAGEAQEIRLAIDVDELELPIYTSYLPFSLPMQCTKGTASGKIDLLFDPLNTKGDKLSIGFQLSTTGVELVNDRSQINIVVPSGQLAGRLQPGSRTLRLNEVALREPTISSFGGFRRQSQGVPGGETEQDNAPYQLLVELLLLDNGVVRFFTSKEEPQPNSVWTTVQLSAKNYRSDTQAIANQGLASQPVVTQPAGSFSLSGEKEGTSASFSWQGKFSTQNSLTGNLHLFKIDGKDLGQMVGGDHPFATAKMQGSGDLRGQLSVSVNKDVAARLDHKLVDAELTLNNFSLADQEHTILEAPLVRMSGLSLIDETIDFGTVQLHNATARFITGQTPEIYRQFTAPKFQLQGLDFAGKVFIRGEKKSASPLLLAEVSLKANELGRGPKGIVDNFSIAARTETGAVVKAQGIVALSPFFAAFKTGFKQLPIGDIWPLFSTVPIPGNIQGSLSGKGAMSLPVTSFTGELELAEVHGTGAGKTPFSWQKAVFSDVKYTTQPRHFGAASVRLDDAHLLWQISPETADPLHYFTDFMPHYFPLADQPNGPATSGETTPVDIDEISFTAGTIDIDDRRASPAWSAKNGSFVGSIKNIRATPTAESPFAFSGQLAGSPFTVTGSVAPFSKEENGTLQFLLNALPLSSFADQFGGQTALDISDAQLGLALDSSWQEQQYISSGKLTLTGLKPLAAAPDIALSLALLSDWRGIVERPFTFSRSTPVGQTALAVELFSSVQHLLLKGRVSPLLLASGDFTDLIGQDSIDFYPGELILTDDGNKILRRYAELLIAHPKAGLILSGGVDKELDGRAIRQSLVAVEQQRVNRENEKLLQQWQDQKKRYEHNLEKRQGNGGQNKIIEEDIPPAILTDFKPLQPVPVTIDEAMLIELAKRRLDAVYQELIIYHDVTPEQVVTVVPGGMADKTSESGSGVAITLTPVSQKTSQ